MSIPDTTHGPTRVARSMTARHPVRYRLLLAIMLPVCLLAAGCNGSTSQNGQTTSTGGITSGACQGQSAPQLSAPTSVTINNLGNATATVMWSPPANAGSTAISGYAIELDPAYNDRLPAPNPPALCVTVGPTTLAWPFTGLLADCHQRYVARVAAKTKGGIGPFAVSDSFRPSGNLVPSATPPYVVILIDGVNESQPGFTMDLSKPTLDGTPSYCPESWNAAMSMEAEADFAGAPNGPWSFMHKWNFGEVDKNGNSTGNDESAPRAWPSNADNLESGTYTHSYMLDAIAAQGAIFIPFSYKGYILQPSQGVIHYTFDPYPPCQATPGCGPTIAAEAGLLGHLVSNVATIWPSARIVVMGHSQGGLIAFTWWTQNQAPSNFVMGFSLDSPINGVCGGEIANHGLCLGPPSYPDWNARTQSVNDPTFLTDDAARNESFRFIGTYGDSPVGGYQDGARTLEHQLLFNYSASLSPSQVEQLCADPNIEKACPAPAPPDHISACPVDSEPSWATAHYVVKYCPANVLYFNSVLGLSYPDSTPGSEPTPTVTPTPGTTGTSNQVKVNVAGVPSDITTGPDGAVWFTEGYTTPNQIGRVTPDGTVTQFRLPSPYDMAESSAQNLTFGPDGSLWVTLGFDGYTGSSGIPAAIGRRSPSGTWNTFPLPAANNCPDGSTYEVSPGEIVPGTDGSLWFIVNRYIPSTQNCDTIGQITQDGHVTLFKLPYQEGSITGITVGPDGAIWFCGLATDTLFGLETQRVWRIMPDGTLNTFLVPQNIGGVDDFPVAITTGPDHNLWFTDTAHLIVRMTPAGAGQFTPYKLNAASFPQLNVPRGIVAGPDNNLWFTDPQDDQIERITPSGTITEYSLPVGTLPATLIVGPDGYLWCTRAVPVESGPPFYLVRIAP